MDANNKKNYVCLSDLHLGAAYSVLSKVDNNGRFSAGTASDNLKNLADGLAGLIPRVFDEPPVLVLLGDCLDFDFATMEDLAEAFKCLMQTLFKDRDRPLFDQNEIVVIPGNHDHRLWQYEKDRLFIQHYPDKGPRYHTTSLFDPQGIPSYFLNSLREQALDRDDGPEIRLYYPNVGIRTSDQAEQQTRMVILHHGHFVESLYRLMTQLHDLLAELLQQLATDKAIPLVEQLERDNGAWIDFLWSSLGASQRGADNASRLFDIMMDPAASHRYIRKLADQICLYISQNYGIAAEAQIQIPQAAGMTVKKLVIGLLETALGNTFQTERMAYHYLLTEAGIDGLRWYLSRPLRDEILKQRVYDSANIQPNVSFIFGHTHKPFQDRLPVVGYTQPVNIYNTGGWVLDDPGLISQQGAAAMFIDKQCNVASLRLFQDPVNQHVAKVHAQGLGNGDEDNPLLKRMQAALSTHEQATCWLTFTNNILDTLKQRATAMRDQFFDPGSDTGII
jgi:hypothetical protein